MANNLQTKLPKDVIKNVVSGESITASLQNQIIDRLNSFPDPKALVSDLEDSQQQTWHLWRLNEFQFTGDLIVDDPKVLVNGTWMDAVQEENCNTDNHIGKWYCGVLKKILDPPESEDEENTEDEDLPEVVYTNNLEFDNSSKYKWIVIFERFSDIDPDSTDPDSTDPDANTTTCGIVDTLWYCNPPVFSGKGGGSSECDCELTPLLDEGVKIATWTKDGVTKDIYAPEPESESECDCELVPVLTTGTKIAEWKKDGQTTDIYAPQGGGSCTCEMEATAEHYDKDGEGHTQQYWPNAEVGKFTDCNGNVTTLYAPNHVQFKGNAYPSWSNMGNVFELASATDSNVRISANGNKLTIGVYYV